VNMTRFLNKLQQVPSKSKVWKKWAQVIPETHHAHYFPNLWSWAYLLQFILDTRHAHYFPNHWFRYAQNQKFGK
jgi:hypothetical protein